MLLAGVLVLAYGAFVALGRQRFAHGSLLAEAHVSVAQFARTMAECIETRATSPDRVRDALPETSPWVPEDPGKLHGAGYRSTAQDWEAPAFACAHMRLDMPQHYQVRWERLDDQHGLVEAALDLDEDGSGEAQLYVKLDCTPSKSGAPRWVTCAIGRVETAPFAKGRTPL